MSKKEYIAKYNKEVYKGYTLRLRRDQDADLIEYLESRGSSPQNVIKDMLRRSMRAYAAAEVRRDVNETVRASRNEHDADQAAAGGSKKRSVRKAAEASTAQE